MKLHEMPYDKYCDTIAALAPLMDAVTDDRRTINEIMRVVTAYSAEPAEVQNKKMLFALVGHVAANHRETVLKIISLLDGRTVEELLQLPGAAIIRAGADCLDEEFMSFFTSPRPMA